MSDHRCQPDGSAKRDVDADALETIQHLTDEVGSLTRELAHTQRLAMLGIIAAGAAHEINNLLTPALAYAQLARQRDEDQEFIMRALQKTERGVERASRIAENMLRYACPARSHKAALGQRANLREVCEQVLETIPRRPERDGIALGVNLPDEIFVAIDSLHLQQVILNLLLNALKAVKGMKNPSIQIDVCAGSGETVMIRVRDNGPGIDASVRDGLFQPFVSFDQSVASTNRMAGGTGLGLAICRRLVEAAAGVIELEQTSSSGTSFLITLPAAASPDACSTTQALEDRAARRVA